MRRFSPLLFAQLFCISLVLLSFSESQGQTRPTLQPKVENRHWPLDTLRPAAENEADPRESRQALVSLNNDFRQLQSVNNTLMLRVFDPGASTEKITNKEIRSSLGEIKKLAERVGYSLGVPKVKAKEETDVALTVALRQLDKAVMSFVRNPLFQSRTYDAEHVSQAGRDLSEVVRLADMLRKLTKQN